MEEYRDKRYDKQGVVGTILFHLLLFLILFFSVMEAQAVAAEGLLVNYGDSNTGSGDVEPSPSHAQNVTPSEPQPSAPTPTPPTPATTPEQPKADGQTTDTQDFEEAAALKEAKRLADEKAIAEKKAKEEALKAEEKRLAEEAVAKAKAQAEARERADAEAKAKAEAEAKAKAEAEAKAKAEAEAAKRKAAQDLIKKGMSGAGTGTSASQGTAGGTGNQGSLSGGAGGGYGTGGTGSGTSGTGSGSYDLAGRTIVGSIPKPTYNVQEQGRVVVEISVDKNGVVTSASVRSKGTTVQNKALWSAAVEAAKKAKFNSDKSAQAVQTGTITYNFKLQ